MNMLGYTAAWAVTFAVNVVAGYWRAHAKARRNRVEWFLAVHAPVPLVALLRRMLGIGFNAASLWWLLGLVAAYFTGQRVGGMAYSRIAPLVGSPSRLLVRDLVRVWGRYRRPLGGFRPGAV